MGANGIYGLSGSGIDIESMVKVGMMSRQNEYDKMAQKYTKNEWMKSAYIELSSSISTFNLTKLSDYKMTASMKAKTAVSSSDAVKATANASADFRTHNVEVTNLVSNAALVGTNKMTRYAITSDTANQSSMKLADVLFNTLEYTDAGNVYGQVAAVNMTADGRTTAAWNNEDDKSLTNYSFGQKTVTADFTNATWDGSQLTTTDGFYTSNITWKNDDTENWKFNEETGYWQRKSATTGEFEDVTSLSFSNVTWDGTKLTANDGSGFYATDITWATNSTEWTDNGNNNFTKLEALDSGTEAFSFTISDGAGHKDTISYTYDQLLGNDGDAKTFYDVVNDINKIKGINITASYDSEYDRFYLYNSKEGSGNDITITFGTDDGIDNARSALVARNFFNNMGLYQSVNGKLIGNDGSAATETDSNALLFKLDDAGI